MISNYYIYPEAKKILNDSGLNRRIKNYLKRNDDVYVSLESMPYILEKVIHSLKSEGYYKNIPKDFQNTYSKTMNSMMNNPSNCFWTIVKPDGKRTIRSETEDVDFFGGGLASLILKQDEMWNHQKFGFSSGTELIGAVSAAMLIETNENSMQGYVWKSKFKDGRIIINEITGDANADMRIFQHDITPYESYDPFNNRIRFKKMVDEGIFSYHGQEPLLLRTVLKYAEQQKLNPTFVRDKGKKLFRWASGLNEEIRVAATRMHRPSMSFYNYNEPLPILDKSNSTSQQSSDHLYCLTDMQYSGYISSDGNLVFSLENDATKNSTVKNIQAVFQPSDVDNIIKGLFYQSIKHLGRTADFELAEVFERYFSNKERF